MKPGFLSLSSKFICMVSLYLVIVSTGVLVIPSMQHRLESGRSTLRLVRATNVSAGLGLAPLTASLGLSTYVVIDRHFGMRAGIASGLALTWLAAFAWFGLELLIGSSTGGTQMETPRTPLATNRPDADRSAGDHPRRPGVIRLSACSHADHGL